MPPERLEQAQDEATLEAIRDQERAGVDIITDGEIRRESYSNKFANALDGIDRDRIGEIVGRTGNKIPVPIVSGPIKRRGPVEVRDVEFLRANTDKTIKITLPGPFTMAQQAVNEYYARRREPGARVRRGRQRGGARSVRRRRRHRAARRAVAASARRGGAPLRRQGDQPRARRRCAARLHCICASAMRRSSRTSRRAAIRFSPSSRIPRRTKSRSRRRSRSSI